MPKPQPAETTEPSGAPSKEPNSIVIDLTGAGGLAPDFWGNFGSEYSQVPYKRILTTDTNTNMMAQGQFNPWVKQGFLAASGATLGSLSFSGTSPTNILASGEVDAVNNNSYMAELGINIFSTNTIGSNTLTNVHQTPIGTTVTDLAIYQLNGVRYLFNAYAMSSSTATANSGVSSSNITATYGNYVNGTAVTLTGSIPTGLSTGTTYYIIGASAGGEVFQLSTMIGGSASTFSTSGTQTFTIHGGFGSIGVSTLPGQSFTDGWLAGVTVNSVSVTNPVNLTSPNPFMRMGMNDYMYIFDGNIVHQVDGTVLGGTSGTITQGVYNTLQSYHAITDAIAFRAQMFIAVTDNNLTPSALVTGNYTNYCYVIVTDFSATTTNTKDILTIPGVMVIKKLYISSKGTLRALCIGSDGLAQIREYNGTQFQLLMKSAPIAVPQYPDGLTQVGDVTVWLGQDGNIYGHGQVLQQDPEVIAQIGQVETGSNLEFAGICMSAVSDNFVDVQLFLSYNTLGTVYYKSSAPFTQSSEAYGNVYPLAGNIFTGLHFLESSTASFYTGTRFASQLSTVGFINVYHMTGNPSYVVPGTTYATIKVYFNGSSTAWGTGSGFAITGQDMLNGYKRLEINQSYVNLVQLEVIYNTANVLQEVTNYYPYIAMVYYSPTNTRG